jgi:hypothetical protein
MVVSGKLMCNDLTQQLKGLRNKIVFSPNYYFRDFFIVIIKKTYQSVGAVRSLAVGVRKAKWRCFLAHNTALMFETFYRGFTIPANKFPLSATGQTGNWEQCIQHKSFYINK